MSLRITHLIEKNLMFGGGKEEKDPRIGLNKFGPFKYLGESELLDKIKLGIIGDKNSIEKGKEIIDLISNEIKSNEPNKWLYPSYPGMNPSTRFNCSIVLSKNWQQNILSSEIDSLLNILDANERIGNAVKLYLEKIWNILDEDDTPDVILCMIPKSIEEYCGISEKTRGAKTPKMTALEKQIAKFKEYNQRFLDDWDIITEIKPEKKIKGYDFRNSLKGKLMAHKEACPIQLLRESTADAITNYDINKKSTRQEPASFAWNFSTGIFYKANGKPWRLAKLRDDTCYVGVSFFKDKLSYNKDIQTSMAQVFTHTGDGLVLRGTDVYVDEITKEPHLDEEQARKLMIDALDRYILRAKRNPIRVVVHKKTLFSEAEIKGFNEAIGNFSKDYVAITSRNNGIRFMRWGSYPILRGTLISLTNRQHILYTSGYTPRIRTYPGNSIPNPLFITHEGDSQIDEICDEILGLTKLNWNTTSFSTYMPITIAFSERVGQILSELEKGKPLKNHYKFYM